MMTCPAPLLLADFSSWFATSWSALAAAILSAAAIYAMVIVYTRLAGVRSFAKMSGFDFAMTIATGSVFASTAMSPSVPLPVGATVMGCLFLIQWGLARGRVLWPGLSQLIDNEPILVMAEGHILQENLRRSGVTRDDLMSKLREANALQLSHVRAVIVETTGDVTVLHGNPDIEISPEITEGVIDRERLLQAQSTPTQPTQHP